MGTQPSRDDGSRPTSQRSGGLAYVSIVSALPGITIPPRAALAIQFLVFEGIAVGLAVWYGLWDALPLATAAILVATVGSGLLLSLDARIRDRSPPVTYRETLFHSSIDVAMGLVAYVVFLTYLVVTLRDPGGGVLVRLLGDPLPVVPVAFGLLVAWDVCYRIGAAWWVSITGLWRTVSFGSHAADDTRRAYLRIELLTVAFAGVQLLLVPFIWADRPLALLVLGHVAAVFVVSGVTAGLLVWR